MNNDKFEARAKALLLRIESFQRTLKESQLRGNEFMPYPTTESNKTFYDILLDTQLLFYCYDQQIPLLVQTLALNKRVDEINSSIDNYAKSEDFANLKYFVEKFLKVLEFRQEP